MSAEPQYPPRPESSSEALPGVSPVVPIPTFKGEGARSGGLNYEGKYRRKVVEDLPSLAEKATHGFAWLMLQTFTGKLVNMGAEILLALWLAKGDFGLRTEVIAVFAFANILQDAGINHVLINRQRRFGLWANAAFWASIGIGLAAGLVLAIAAPIVAHTFHEKALLGMTLVLALRSPIAALGAVPYAKLQIQLRYRALAIIGFLIACLTAGSSVVLARLGFGAYSFVWPLLIAAAARSAVFWWVAPTPVKFKLQARRWRYLTTQSGLSLLAIFFLTITSQGDFMVLGWFYPSAIGAAVVVGVYGWAFNLCVQTTQFFTTNLANVLLPTLGRLQNEPVRLKSAFLRATRLLAIFGVFACLLQAAVALPMIQCLFRPKADPDKWIPAVATLRVISLAMALQLFNMPALSLIQAQGRFRTMLKLSIGLAIGFTTLMILAASMGHGDDGEIRFPMLRNTLNTVFAQPVNVGIVVALAQVLYCSIVGPLCMYLAIKPVGGTMRDIWPIYVWPVVTSAVAIFCAMMIGRLCNKMPVGGTWTKLFVVPILSAIFYYPLVKMTSRDAWDEMANRLKTLLNRGSGITPPEKA